MTFPLVPRIGAAAAKTEYLSCADDRARRHHVVGLAADGTQTFQIPLPARGHGFATHVDAPPIVFARRPGSFALALDARWGEIVAAIAPPKGRCFYGHGTYSTSGTLLYVCEHDDTNGDGFIGVYDARANFRRLGEFGAGGIGPHEVRAMPDGGTLVVAIGGIKTDAVRDKLNLDTMDPSLAYIDARTGRVLEQVRPPAGWHQLSIRHIDLDVRGRVALAMQYEGEVGAAVPLAALHARGEPEFRYLRAPEDEELRLRRYLGDIAFSQDGKTICATSPVGSVAALWDGARGDYLAMTEAADGCGILGRGGGFLVSGGDGRLRRIERNLERGLDAARNDPIVATNWPTNWPMNWLWDNHLYSC